VGRARRLVIGSAGAVAGYASGKVLLRRRHRAAGYVLPEGDDLLGSARGRPEIVRGPRSSRIYTERFSAGPAAGSNGAGHGTDGKPAGTIVFTHGWCVTEAIWDRQKRDLAGGPHALLTWDLPGHGHSTPVARDHLSLDLAVDALARVVHSIPDEEPLLLVGHSLGGVLSIGYLLRHSETARRRVRGAVLAATPLVNFAHSAAGRWPGASIQARILGQASQLVVENGAVDRYFAREAGSRDTSAASYRLIRTGFGERPDPAQVLFVRDMAASVPPSVRADTFRAMTGFDLRPRLRELETPMLLVVGGHDRLVNPDEAKELAPSIPHARVEEFTAAGHALFLEEHERFTELVRGFAAKRLGPRRPAGVRASTRAPDRVPPPQAGTNGATSASGSQPRGGSGSRPGGLQ